MIKVLFFFIFILPLGCFAQFTISGRALNQADKKPVSNASVFLSNSSIGAKTADDGAFSLSNAKPGKYDLVISIVGFETYHQTLVVNSRSIVLPDILISPKTILLNEVSIKSVVDPNRERNYEWFKEEFLGTSELAAECRILNPEILDLAYDEKSKVLTASSPDFLEIGNNALGYKIKYLLTNFKLDNGPRAKFRLDYTGPVLFEEMKGSPAQQKRWLRRRQETYQGSDMHFLRSALGNLLEQEGFRALWVKKYINPARPSDSLIESKIDFFKKVRSRTNAQRDSLSFWNNKAKLPKAFIKLERAPLHKEDIIKPTDQPGLFAIGPGNLNDALYVAYNKSHHYHINFQPEYLNNPNNNKENTLVNFIAPYAFFDSNGWPAPNGLIFTGVWGTNRVAELLPVNYEPPTAAMIQEDSTAADKVIAKLSKFGETHDPEKAYLQFDKPYYAAGDTIYYKAYVTMGGQHQLSNLSGVLHVDLINADNKIDQSIKLRLDSGVAWGDFALPDSLPTGNYRVRAYTKWMLNDADRGFFEKNIPVGSLGSTQIPENMVRKPVQTQNEKADIQFFPEGGSMATDIRSKVAFKAIGANGLGISVKGEIIDNRDNEITAFSSTHLGMGYFYLQPEEGKTYKAKLTYANGEQGIVDLPAPDAKGIVLSVNNDAIPDAKVKIQTNKAYYRKNKGKDYTLVIYSGGTATSTVLTLDSATVNLDVLKRRRHTGIATMTLFSPAGEPLCERLLFVQNYEQLTLNVNSDKTAYTKREKINIKLAAINRAGNPTAGNFSVSVTDENKVPVDENNENTIVSNLLLTSDLKGYVEQPNYYFADTSSSARNNLDILMLTQGYRSFEWKRVLGNGYPPIAYQPEKGFEISGMVKNLFGKPVASGTVTLISAKKGPVLSSVTDDNGIFHFPGLLFTDTARFVLSAVNASGKNSTKITYFNNEPEPAIALSQVRNTQKIADTTMASLLDNDKLQQDELVKYGHTKGVMLKEVKIRAKKIDDDYQTQSLAGAGHADQVMHADEIERVQGPLATSLNGRLRGVSFQALPDGSHIPVLTLNIYNTMPYNPPHPMLVVLDGVENTDGDLSGLQANDIETVEVLRFASSSIYGMNGGNGVLVITTKRGGGLKAKDIPSVGVLPIAASGFYKAREFYSPKYDNSTQLNKQRDLRSTIYWKPEIKTDRDGSASFEYYNADGTGTYRMVIEGIDDKGNLGRQVYRYRVE